MGGRNEVKGGFGWGGFWFVRGCVAVCERMRVWDARWVGEAWESETVVLCAMRAILPGVVVQAITERLSCPIPTRITSPPHLTPSPPEHNQKPEARVEEPSVSALQHFNTIHAPSPFTKHSPQKSKK